MHFTARMHCTLIGTYSATIHCNVRAYAHAAERRSAITRALVGMQRVQAAIIAQLIDSTSRL